jgi:hypothetical protein
LNVIQKRYLRFIAILLILPLFTVAYLKILDVLPHPGARFTPGWEDAIFGSTSPEALIWSDESFDEGWTVAWLYGQSNSSGFKTINSTLVLASDFKGYNSQSEDGVSGIIVTKEIIPLSTLTSPFLIIKHIESSSNTALMFSFAITDASGLWHSSGMYHTSESVSTLSFDLRTLFNGTIESISILFTNAFDPEFAGGLQYAYVQSVAIYGIEPSDWILSSSDPVPAGISSGNGVLTVTARGNLTQGLIVSAQRTRNLDVNLTPYYFLKISIMTSSIDVAARIVIWPTSTIADSKEVLLKTYNDNQWHTEIVDLSLFGLTNRVFEIELGFVTLADLSSETYANYGQLSFNMLEVRT